jgi:KDO2-lipid IV(A) lauroyltransferase
MTPQTRRTPLQLAGDIAVAVPACLLMLPLWCLPYRAATALGRGYGFMLFFLYGPGRRAGQINLRHAYGATLSRPAARRAVRRVFAAMGEAFAEGLQFAARCRGGRGSWESLIDYEDPELAARILADPGPKIFVTAHLGSWEVATAVAALRGGGGSVVLRRLDNVVLDRLFQRFRMVPGGRVIEKRGAAFAALAALRAGQNVALLADENAGRRGEWIPFFGREASTHRLPALLACQTGSPVVVAVAVRRPGGRLLTRLATIEPPAVPEVASIAAISRSIAVIFERWIREDPLQWRWIHWRWKHRPDGSEEQYRREDLAAAFAAPDGHVTGLLRELP